MTPQIIKKNQLTPAKWDGGLTYEYLIFPPTAVYGQRNFDFRISSAAIEKTPSVFTRFDGYTRFLVMLDNELQLTRNEISEHYAQNEVFRFNSHDAITSFSLGNDFNLMLANSSNNHKVAVSVIDNTNNNQFMAFFALTNCTFWVNQQEYSLQPYDLLFIDNSQLATITLKSSNEVISCFIN